MRATQPSPALRDRLAGEQMLAERWERLPDGRRRHLRIVQDAERQRPVRVVDIYEKIDGVETLVSQTAMLADRLLLSLQTPQQADALQARLAQAGYRAVPSGSPYLLLIELDAGGIDAVPAAMRDLADIAPGGAAPGPDYLRFPTATPDDPLFPYQYAHELIGSEEAWDVTSGSSSVVVAILDTGMQLDHPDLAANLWTNPGEIPGNEIDDDGNGFKDDVHGWDVFDDDNDPSDEHGHGTHVSGIVGAVGGNGTGVTGVSGTVSLLPMRVGSQSFLSSDVVEALDYIRDLKLNRNVNVVVSNNSYSGEGYTTAEYDAIARQGEAGILFVAAAGNDGIDVDEQPRYPGALDISAIINVANSDQDDKLADGSNYGAVSVDICASGTSIYSTAMGGDYQLWSGTSMAAPHVAGAVALAFAADPQAESATVRTLLLEQADQVATMDGKIATGSRLSLSRLVDAVAGVSRVEVSSPGKAVSLDSLGTTLVLRAEVTVAGEAVQPESAVEWVVDPSEGVTVTAESLTQARAVFSQEGIYTLTASVETGGVVRTDTRQVVAAGRPVSSGLAAEWLFDGEGNPVDSSGNGLDAVFEGGAGRGTGVAEGAYAGTGTEGEHARVDHLPSLPEVSVSAWVKADSEAGLFPRIVDGPEWAFFLGLTGGTDIKCLKFVRYYEDDVYSWYTPEGTIEAGLWYHVAVTWKDTDTAPNLYINGVAQEVGGRGFKVGGLRVGGGTAYLGTGPDGNRSLDGQIDELRIYTRVLSPEEVALLAANHSPVPDGLSAGTVTETQEWSPHVSVTDEDGPVEPALLWS
ncbi:MAG: S8 family serine peptidase, partial [Puniceicoccales bacterium]